MKFLITTIEQYRVPTEAEAVQLIEEAKKSPNFVLTKYKSELKERKQKNEIIDSWYRVTLTKQMTDEREPMERVSVNYERE